MPALRALIIFTLLTGLAYPLFILGLGRLCFPVQAGGSLTASGSALIGQHFDQPHYFWPRPSATSPNPYNAAVSSGSNMGPLHPDLKKPAAGMPLDLATASASGLDPHISPQAARYQIARVSAARKLPASRIAAIVERFVEPPQFGILGEARVNVLLLNQALDQK